MNYRHAFHAGNHADVLKHVVLLAMLDALMRKDAPFFVLDTHAGRGRYLLRGSQAGRTGEASTGILQLAGARKPPEVVARYLRAVAADNPVDALLAYPGSPLLVALVVPKTAHKNARQISTARQSACQRRLLDALAREPDPCSAVGDWVR